MFKSVALVGALAQVCLSQEFSLHARTLDGQSKHSLGIFNYDSDTHQITPLVAPPVVEDSIRQDVPYCIDADSKDPQLQQSCFTLMELETILHYNLVLSVDTDTNDIQKFSLIRNENATTIEPIVQDPAMAPVAPAVLLKKKTKTYADKKKDTAQGAEQFSKATEKSEEEEDDRNYLQKNWKQLVIGLVIYNVVTSIMKPKNEKKE
ncbi:similar to Saccharomyces cerevisiae YDR056C Putative protein of unknown function [Maudiozyma barnettii]|uniref:ER membrane protein complex subunit 10 n=1 Tax=Maudiozyma barnettii TaxID=61262 RepID=A0A8H2ZFD1_9SACH|nr:Emc10p [Kazachstania barnettii]CAB4253106.1 similar to Saccharomyces cerevisiae YDR056C Putative protein of unknown function [Kazachstania barnettii]CAD1780359.1 similar to Saccharomyces cerevisiae YDR056C Putative protein of unknown function [Kazachstania barnettii]